MSSYQVKDNKLSAAYSQYNGVISQLDTLSSRLTNQYYRLSGNSGYGIETLKSEIWNSRRKLDEYKRELEYERDAIKAIHEKSLSYEQKATGIMDGSIPTGADDFVDTIAEKFGDTGGVAGDIISDLLGPGGCMPIPPILGPGGILSPFPSGFGGIPATLIERYFGDDVLPIESLSKFVGDVGKGVKGFDKLFSHIGEKVDGLGTAGTAIGAWSTVLKFLDGDVSDNDWLDLAKTGSDIGLAVTKNFVKGAGAKAIPVVGGVISTVISGAKKYNDLSEGGITLQEGFEIGSEVFYEGASAAISIAFPPAALGFFVADLIGVDDIVKDGMTDLMNASYEFGGKLYDWGVEAGEAISAWGEDFLNGTSEFIDNVADGARDVVDNIAEGAKDVIDGAADLIGDGIEAVSDGLSTVVDGIGDFLFGW